MTASYEDIAAQLARLERLPAARPGVVSVYLNNRVQTTGGTVETILSHAGLAAAGGLAARLRYGR